MADITKDWELYNKGKKFCNSLEPDYFKTVETNLDFYAGNQWRNVKANGMPTPVFNIIKRSISFFVSSICSQNVTIEYEPLEGKSEDEEQNPDISDSDIATAEVKNLFDKFKMESKIREALTDSAIMGDIAAHIYFDVNSKPYGGSFGEVKGEIKFELVDGTNVFFGNPNNKNVDTKIQPYIIISGRDTVENLKKEAARNKHNPDDISTDKANEDMAGQYGQIEIEGDKNGKATYIIIYRPVTKTETKQSKDTMGNPIEVEEEVTTIHVSKCTQNAYMYEDVDTGLNHYPIAWLNWEKSKNLYHGRALATGMIPNQIFINRMFAMVMYHLMTAAFPKAVYDQSRVIEWSNEIGQAIPIDSLAAGESVRNIAGYLEVGNMSNQITQVIEMAIQHTKDSLGINDNMLGNINPEQASGKSIVATVQQAQIPLENQKSNLIEWIEDIGKILLDVMGTNYGLRPIYIDVPQIIPPATPMQAPEKRMVKQLLWYDFSIFKNMYLNCRTNVGASNYWSEIASVETLTNIYQQGGMDIIDYLKSLPDGYIRNRTEIIDSLQRKQDQQEMMAAAMQMQTMNQPPMAPPMQPNIPPKGVQR